MSLVSERISQHCKRLKLIHLASEWPAIAESSIKDQDSLADFLDKLVQVGRVRRDVNSSPRQFIGGSRAGAVLPRCCHASIAR